ncbi:MAG TPA: hypothetical protein PLM53_10815 [Spirochaetota bacterium]|nr:hypothetical protein [Spirochaetota bacterium]HQF08718.1 hypothetical protein [Spirochaetota bacterium]HQH97581.1 hypothetical protein [Spirochaetota bacterium]HQJ71292.1 hypothetical protein [Spirochaetota bacterium]
MDPDRTGRAILYYAMGGGLGHLTRTLAIADEMGPRSSSLRILCSSNFSPMVLASTGHAIDHVTGDTLASRESYYGFLSDYIERHQFSLIILDTFPFGIVGEWLTLAPDIPRLLVARSLKWDRYTDVVNTKETRSGRHFPSCSLVIEPLDNDYETVLRDNSSAANLHEPILRRRSHHPGSDPSTGLLNRCAVVHSGNENERNSLLDYAAGLFRERDMSVPIDTVFPDQQVYPADGLVSSYRYIVSAAGYNMAALASQAGPHCQHYLFPFTRKYDDQHARKKHVESGLWKDRKADGAVKAARWIEDFLQ